MDTVCRRAAGERDPGSVIYGACDIIKVNFKGRVEKTYTKLNQGNAFFVRPRAGLYPSKQTSKRLGIWSSLSKSPVHLSIGNAESGAVQDAQRWQRRVQNLLPIRLPASRRPGRGGAAPLVEDIARVTTVRVPG